MSEKQQSGPFRANFDYTEEVLKDFEKMYQIKRETPLAMRIVFGLLGFIGAVYFGYLTYRDGFQFTIIGYLIICSLMMLVALSKGKNRPDESVGKYRKYYLNKTVSFLIDENGVEMRLEGQKSFARSKFKEIYGLFETDMCFYFVIKGKAYYILSKAGITEGAPETLKKYMQKKCAKSFLHYDVS